MATKLKSKRLVRRGARKTTARRPARPVRKAAAKARTNGSAEHRAAAVRRQPETLRLRSLTPTYTVNDLEKSIAWYCDGLGCVVSERWEEGGKVQGVMLKAGSCTFGLSQDDFGKGRDRQKGVGFRIYAETVQSVDALVERIRAYGGRVLTEPTDMSWGARIFSVEDPDGFVISFSQTR